VAWRSSRPGAAAACRLGDAAARTPPDKREAIGKEIQADARKYVDDVLPVIRDRAVKLAPTTVGVLLDERFTEDELKQLVAIIENPVYRKYQQMDGEMTRSLQAKLVTELRPRWSRSSSPSSWQWPAGWAFRLPRQRHRHRPGHRPRLPATEIPAGVLTLSLWTRP
jgi:hypothetical protein